MSVAAGPKRSLLRHRPAVTGHRDVLTALDAVDHFAALIPELRIVTVFVSVWCITGDTTDKSGRVANSIDVVRCGKSHRSRGSTMT